MEAIYWVLTWACHRRCKHCYDERFRPYSGEALRKIVSQGQAGFPSILRNLPDEMHYRDARALAPDGTPTRRRTLLVLAGGELLLDGVREELFYPVLEAIQARWGQDGPHVSVQTTGDVLKPAHIEGMLQRGVGTIAIASIDDFHVGLEGDKKFALMERVRALMAPFGVREIGLGIAGDARLKAPSARARWRSWPFFSVKTFSITARPAPKWR